MMQISKISDAIYFFNQRDLENFTRIVNNLAI
ncbi:hypothetical protein Deia_00713 [Candidatus Deianiraea vastatrix]|uniref:Uncharacterized protein n=1 Tax=Candidatus Deianiraea vastatrix TaxID=2163644 RepID=A0A5B8XH43_9RICK|nr:hypothetical protein Deia_00713 [Candidatus Deianiraea vastatrix]